MTYALPPDRHPHPPATTPYGSTDLPGQPRSAARDFTSEPGHTRVPDRASIDAARASCATLDRRDSYLAHRFYEHLFWLAPDTRAMFPADMSVQTERLFIALLDAVNAMDLPESIRPQLRALGRHHARRYGVTGHMYVYVGQALIRAVRDVTGDHSTLTTSAWASVYQWLADEMIAGARESGYS
ncbi:MAG: globin domain-containing protein [Micromonosporaceae bacterium]